MTEVVTVKKNVVALRTRFFFSECLGADDPKGLKYNGLVNKTKSGKTCQAWAKQRPHSHRFKRLADQGNFCRNPDSEPAPWCYTTLSGTRWELCDIPDCGKVARRLKKPIYGLRIKISLRCLPLIIYQEKV